MKKTNLFFVITLLAMLFYFKTTLAADEQASILFCPEKIVCTQDKRISSCKTVGEHLEYWGNPYALGTITKGSHFLYEVRSTYQHLNHGLSSLCIYRNASYPTTTLNINNFDYIKNTNSKALFWEASLNDRSAWNIEGFLARCMDNEQPISPEKCPLEPMPLIKINTLLETEIAKISIYVNGMLIQSGSLSTDKDNHVHWIGINIYQAWDTCTDAGLCTMELMESSKGTLIDMGHVVVDMEQKFKIISIHALPGFKILHDAKTNSIQISKIK